MYGRGKKSGDHGSTLLDMASKRMNTEGQVSAQCAITRWTRLALRALHLRSTAGTILVIVDVHAASAVGAGTASLAFVNVVL